jgi:uncharacterized repeat protein (TIGR01451 family)
VITGGTILRLLWLKAALLIAAAMLFSVASPAEAEPPARADMAIFDVSDFPDPATQSEAVRYQVEMANLGPSTATDVRLTVQLPTGLRFEPSMSDSSCTESAGMVTCSFASWDANAAGVIVLSATATTPGLIDLTFHVTANEPDPHRANNTSVETTQVNEAIEADLSIAVGDAQGYAGQPIFLSVGVFNGGPADATGITVTLEFPSGLALAEGEQGSCTVGEGGTTTCQLGFGSIPSGRGSARPIELHSDTAGTYSVTGSVSADQPDPNTSNNSDVGTVAVHPAADLSVSKADSSDPAKPGQKLTYTVTVTNSGPSPATEVKLFDTWNTDVSGGAVLLSFTPTQGSCAQTGAASIECQLGTIAAGANAVVTIVLRPRGSGTISNTASVSAAEFDADSANNSVTEMTQVGKA